ncbi:MAG: fumarylacetoacetate hydrolase family protein [Bacteroidota bacterium]
MKIICIGWNYHDHAKELNNPIPKEPVFFLKPDSALIRDNKPFYLPGFSHEIHHEVEIVLKIGRLGKNIKQAFASRYYDEIGIGIDFTARDIQRQCKKEGKPWEIAKAFDGSAPVGSFITAEKFRSKSNINFELIINGQQVQAGNTGDMIFSFDKIIEYVSQFMTLKIGDLIFTGTPVGVGPVEIGDHLVASIEGQELLNFHIK